MPPVSSGSRTALITWSVVFAILFVTASVFSIYFYADSAKARESEEKTRKQYADIAQPGELAGDVVAQLREAKSSPPEGSSITPSMGLLQVAVAQRDELAHMIAGPAVTTPAAALERALIRFKQAAAPAKDSNITISPTDNLAGALTAMSNGVAMRKKESDTFKAQLEQAKTENKTQATQFEELRTKINQDLEAVRAEEAKARAAMGEYQQSKDQSVQQIEAGQANERKLAADALNAANVQVADLNRQVTQLKQQVLVLHQKLGENRVNTEDPIVRHPDGHIIRMPAKDVVYIDLGASQSVTPGLTFEVYDKIDGIPPAGDPTNNDKLPKGKASIEVVHVGPTSSECRIIRSTLGQTLSEGDLIANLVFDPNVKYNFVVFGDFDLDQNHVATPQDADVLKRLVTQWGGKIMDGVNVDTDFVVLGKEPVVPSFSKEELQDPFNAKKLQDAQAAADAYAKVRDTAKELHIPILNENRFLYLTGYYEMAKR